MTMAAVITALDEPARVAAQLGTLDVEPLP